MLGYTRGRRDMTRAVELDAVPLPVVELERDALVALSLHPCEHYGRVHSAGKKHDCLRCHRRRSVASELGSRAMDRIDLRSDTVTQPTTAMWEAMRRARLGDDVLGDEPTVRALERKVARLLGKEEALFVPSGTMANQIAIRCHCRLGDEIIAHRESHVVHYETGAPAGLS